MFLLSLCLPLFVSFLSISLLVSLPASLSLCVSDSYAPLQLPEWSLLFRPRIPSGEPSEIPISRMGSPRWRFRARAACKRSVQAELGEIPSP